jgi:DNA-binding protein HU-beta
MSKTELAKQVAAAAGLTAEQAKSAVDAVFATIAGELAAGHDVAIVAFGKFSVAERAAREGRNPATGDDPDRRQPRCQVLRGCGAQAAAQQLSRGRRRAPTGRSGSRRRRGAGARARGVAGASVSSAAVIFQARVEPVAASTMPSRSSRSSAAVTRSRPGVPRSRADVGDAAGADDVAVALVLGGEDDALLGGHDRSDAR